MSDVACVACIEGITRNAANRGMSSSATICACSTRNRLSFSFGATPAAAKAFVYASSTRRFARSPMACAAIWNPAASARPVNDSSASCGTMTSPVFPGSSVYGSISAAPRDPSAPSTTTFTARTVKRPSPWFNSGPDSKNRLTVPASLDVIIAYTRNGNSPASIISRYASIVSPSAPASCTPVNPCNMHSAIAARSASRRSAGVGDGTCARTRPIAASINTPVGLPCSSR